MLALLEEPANWSGCILQLCRNDATSCHRQRYYLCLLLIEALPCLLLVSLHQQPHQFNLSPELQFNSCLDAGLVFSLLHLVKLNNSVPMHEAFGPLLLQSFAFIPCDRGQRLVLQLEPQLLLFNHSDLGSHRRYLRYESDYVLNFGDCSPC